MRDVRDENWPEFRGPSTDGHSSAKGIPIAWSETKNVAWKTPVPGTGFSSPVVWGNQIWLTTAEERGHEQSALCFERATGKLLARVTLFQNASPQPISVDANGYASPSPVIENGRAYCHFGTFGTACIDTKSYKVLWTRRDLNCDHSVGPGSSPFLLDNLLVLTFDGIDVQFLVGLDTKTGKTVWKTPRGTDFSRTGPEQRKAFTTPFLLTRGNEKELLSVGARFAVAYAPRTGKELWRVAHPGYSNASRPVATTSLLFINTGFNTPELWAVKLDRPSGPTDDDVLWRYRRGVPTMSSPLLVDDLLYFVADTEMLTCLDAATGTEVWRERIGGRHYASPVLAEGRIYLFAENGKAKVLAPGRTYKLLADNILDSGCHASPAVVGREVILRTHTHLYCLRNA